MIFFLHAFDSVWQAIIVSANNTITEHYHIIKSINSKLFILLNSLVYPSYILYVIQSDKQFYICLGVDKPSFF